MNDNRSSDDKFAPTLWDKISTSNTADVVGAIVFFPLLVSAMVLGVPRLVWHRVKDERRER